MTRALLRCSLKLFIGMQNENERIIKKFCAGNGKNENTEAAQDVTCFEL